MPRKKTHDRGGSTGSIANQAKELLEFARRRAWQSLFIVAEPQVEWMAERRCDLVAQCGFLRLRQGTVGDKASLSTWMN